MNIGPGYRLGYRPGYLEYIEQGCLIFCFITYFLSNSFCSFSIAHCLGQYRRLRHDIVKFCSAHCTVLCFILTDKGLLCCFLFKFNTFPVNDP